MTDLQRLLVLLKEAKRSNFLPGILMAEMLTTMGYPRLARWHGNCTIAEYCVFTANLRDVPRGSLVDCTDPHRWLAYMERDHND